MLSEARDVWATFFLERELAKWREEVMEQVLSGNTPDGTDREQPILQKYKDEFFGEAVARVLKRGSLDEAELDQQFEQRTQKLAEHAVWMTHRRLARLPFVGQPEYRED